MKGNKKKQGTMVPIEFVEDLTQLIGAFWAKNKLTPRYIVVSKELADRANKDGLIKKPRREKK